MATPNFGSDALGRNTYMAQRARDRRFDETVNRSPSRAVGGPDLGPGWDALFESINDNAETAAAQGKRSSVNLTGIANTSSPAIGSGGRPGGGSQMGTDAMTARSIDTNRALSDDADRFNRNRASLRILEAQARQSEDDAFESDWRDDPYRQRQATGQALERQGSINEFGRGEQVKDAAHAGTVFQAGEPARRMADYEALGRARERYPFSKEKAEVDKAQIEAGAKVREAETNRARESSAGLRALSDLAKTRSTVPPEIDDPAGGQTGGFFGMGAKPKRVPNPAYGDLSDSLRVAQSVIGGQNRGGAATTDVAGKVMSQDDLLAFAESNKMDPADAAALAKQHGWTVR